jgi:hypothetical protein
MRKLRAIGSGQLESPGKSLAIPVDQLGIWTSTLCVIHCLMTPIVLSISAVSAHFLPSEERTHRTLAVVIATLGALALVRGYRSHRSFRVLLIMIAGLSCIFAGAFWGDRLPSHGFEVLITLVGSGFMIAAHRMNHTFCRDCSCGQV